MNDTGDIAAILLDAGSAEWAVRKEAGCRLAAHSDAPGVAVVLLRLLDDVEDTAVIYETAVALLAADNVPALRLVLFALSRAEPSIADHLAAALSGDPRHTRAADEQRLQSQLAELMNDDDPLIRHEARTLHRG